MRSLLLLALLLPLSAQETMIREVFDPKTDTHVEVTALFTQPSSRGWFPIRVKVANNLNSDRSIQIGCKSSPNWGDELVARSSTRITAPAGKTVIRDIMVPLCSSPTPRGYQASVSVTLSGSLGNASNTIRAENSHANADVLMSEALFTPNASKLDAALSKSAGSRYGSSQFAGKFDPKNLPDNWLAFSGYDSILMTDADWSNTPAGPRNAILSWVRLGGQLLVYSNSKATPASLGLPADASFGNCTVLPLASDLMLPPSTTLDVVDSSNPVPKQASSINNDYQSGWPLQAAFGAKTFHYGIFVAVLVLFGVLVGPVNLFIFAKSGKRHRLFITTPLISLGASLVLIALIILQDGFGGDGMRRVLMEVRPDDSQNAAFLHQEQISRTGILTRSSFTIDPICLFSPVPIAKSRWARYTRHYSAKGNFSIQPEGAKMVASGDWFKSRSEHGHLLTAVVPTRGRIERGADPLTFVSTFGFPLQTLFYLDESEQWHRAESIATGKPFTLTPVDASMAEPALAHEAGAFTARLRGFLQKAKNRPGHFVAITRDAPGIDTYPGIDWQKTQTVITGPVTTP